MNEIKSTMCHHGFQAVVWQKALVLWMQEIPWISEFPDQRIAQSMRFSVLGDFHVLKDGVSKIPDMMKGGMS